MTFSLLVALLLLIAGLTWWANSSDVTVTETKPPPTPTPASPAATPAKTSARYTAPVATRTPEPEAKRRMLLLPNGDYVPALNGVIDAPAMEWPAYLPFSPIIGRESTATLDWYVHADGSKSTTQMAFRKDLGRMAPVTTVANPAPVGELPPGEPGRKSTGDGHKAGSAAGGASEVKR